MEEINYTNKVVKYNKGKFEIENLKEGTMMMGYLQKVGWVVLKSGFIIKPRSLLENTLCDLNIDVPSDKLHWFGIDNSKRQIYYKQSFNNHNTRFLRPTPIVELHDLLKYDCQVINDHLIEYYDFADNNLYKYYNPNLIRNHGNVKNDQSLHCDFPTSVEACTTLSYTESDKYLPAKKRKINESDKDLPTNKRKRPSRKKMNLNITYK